MVELMILNCQHLPDPPPEHMTSLFEAKLYAPPHPLSCFSLFLPTLKVYPSKIMTDTGSSPFSL